MVSPKSEGEVVGMGVPALVLGWSWRRAAERSARRPEAMGWVGG